MAINDSFGKSGTVPFKWEIKPGVPTKLVQQEKQPLLQSPASPSHKLKPPPILVTGLVSIRAPCSVISISFSNPFGTVAVRQAGVCPTGPCLSRLLPFSSA